ncbi:MAG: HAD-IA family hydrolase [Nocardioidaceae bacterium]
MTVSILLLDADGVLQRVPGGWEESMRPAVEGRVEDVERFMTEAYAAERPALLGKVRWLDVLPVLLERWGIPQAYDDLLRIWLSIEAVPGVREIVGTLRGQGIRCCLATNQDVTRGELMHELLGYGALLDASFYSYELGVAKPDPAYFTAILGRLGADAQDVLFVDDNARNVEAARSVGLAAEHWVHTDGLDALREHLARHDLPV